VRSTRLLVLAAAGAVAVGAAAALLKPSGPPDVSPGNLAVRADEVPTIDPAALRRDMLDGLVRDAAVRDPARLPALTTFTALFVKGDDAVLDRLLRDDVPPALALAFAERLPRGTPRAAAAVDRLLGPLLLAIPQDDRSAAVAVLRGRGRLPTESVARCRCIFGVHDGPAGRTAVAMGVTPAVRLRWNPSVGPDGLVLHVEEDPEGSHVLSTPLDAPGPVHAHRPVALEPLPKND